MARSRATRAWDPREASASDVALALEDFGLDLAQRRRELRAAVREVAEGRGGARL